MKNAKDQGSNGVESNTLITVPIGYLTQCTFYISDEKAIRRGMAFSVAYTKAMQSNNNKDLCTCVLSMICDVFGTGLHSSMEATMEEICAKPLFVSLPSQARGVYEQYDARLDLPTILFYFGCCIIILYNKGSIGEDNNYMAIMNNPVRGLREVVRRDPSTKLDIPFNFIKANAIRTMLGACPKLRSTVFASLEISINKCGADTRIGAVCQYLLRLLK